jgi:hypothetical protein
VTSHNVSFRCAITTMAAGAPKAHIHTTTMNQTTPVRIPITASRQVLGSFEPRRRERSPRATPTRAGTGPLHNIGDVYDSLGEKQKALDFHNQAAEVSARSRRPF